MKTPRLAQLLLLSTALAVPTLAQAQDATTDTAGSAEASVAATNAEEEGEAPEISVPGGEIIVTGRRDRNVERSAPQVVSVLSTADIARTGEGNIAGALGRVTGLSVVGNGYVYVRGLGDRYSLALLNGSPLPSPEPLKRVVPLDLFPSGLIASSLVQKSYSANYPGEFGGGVINLTTKAIPDEGFITGSVGVSGDTETTNQLGYTYYGSNADWLGYDGGARDIPPALQAFLDSGERLSSGNVDTQAIGSQLITTTNSLVRRDENMPANFSGSLSAGNAWDFGDTRLGVIAAAGYSNKWQNKQPHQETAGGEDLSVKGNDFLGLTTENRIVVNGMLGLGLEFGENRIRWTNLIIRDTIKQSRLSTGTKDDGGVEFMRQNTGWYERQLIDTQLVGEFKLTPDLSLGVRGGYANSRRDAPFELFYEYVRTNASSDPLGGYFVNRLNNGNGGDAHVIFSELDEDLWSASGDLSYNATSSFTVTAGGAFSDTRRTSSRREFQFLAPPLCDAGDPLATDCLPAGVTLLRPDRLLEPAIINAFDIEMIESDEGSPAFLGRLRNYAGFAKANWQLTDTISLDAGARYEWARLSVDPIQVFTVPSTAVGVEKQHHYILPAATLTWEIEPAMQVRVSASKTIARPQFRELIDQAYFDPDSSRQYKGNPYLDDSELYNAEARFEWYFAPEQRLSLSGFYKKIDRPIEAYLDASNIISYANAPQATLYGGEIEAQKYVGLGGEGFFKDRRLTLIANYTYTQSELKVGPDDKTAIYGVGFDASASIYFRDGAAMTGQSDHIANLEIGLENEEKLSQQTFMITYASDRVISRGVFGLIPGPDVVERPGLRLDFVAREGIKLFGVDLELKFEARNLTGRKHIEVQSAGGNTIDSNTYDVGRSFAFSVSATL